MFMCKHCSEALLKHFQSVCHSSKNQHAELTGAALMQCARESQFIHHTRQFAESSESSGAEAGPYLCLGAYLLCVRAYLLCGRLLGNSTTPNKTTTVKE